MLLRSHFSVATASAKPQNLCGGSIRLWRQTQLTACAGRWRPRIAALGDSQNEQPGPGPASPSGQVREFSAYTSVDEWKKLDSKVNKYPCMRSFQAIGVADPSFKPDLVAAVSEVVGSIHVECVSERPSSGGKYTAVRIGPVHVQSSDQVVEIFKRIKETGGARLKWFM